MMEEEKWTVEIIFPSSIWSFESKDFRTEKRAYEAAIQISEKFCVPYTQVIIKKNDDPVDMRMAKVRSHNPINIDRFGMNEKKAKDLNK